MGEGLEKDDRDESTLGLPPLARINKGQKRCKTGSKSIRKFEDRGVLGILFLVKRGYLAR